jgi:hypothetical protein
MPKKLNQHLVKCTLNDASCIVGSPKGVFILTFPLLYLFDGMATTMLKPLGID